MEVNYIIRVDAVALMYRVTIVVDMRLSLAIERKITLLLLRQLGQTSTHIRIVNCFPSKGPAKVYCCSSSTLLSDSGVGTLAIQTCGDLFCSMLVASNLSRSLVEPLIIARSRSESDEKLESSLAWMGTGGAGRVVGRRKVYRSRR